ncbi:MAG: hypothetical protein AB7G44_16060 [Bacteroidia bacterium]
MKKIIYSLCLVIMISAASYAQTGSAAESTPVYKGTVGSSELPEHVKATIDKEFPRYVVVTFRENEKQDMIAPPYYDVEVSNGKQAYIARVAQDGKLMSKTKKKAAKKNKNK